MSKKWLKSSAAMIMASLVIASGATVLTTGVAEAGNIGVSAATVNEALTVSNFSVSNTNGSYMYMVDDTLRFSATITGGQRYKDGYTSTKIYVKNLTTGKNTTVDYAKNPSYIKDTWKPTEAGSYSATFKVVDYNGVTAESTIYFTVLAKLTVSNFGVSNTNGSYKYMVGDTLRFSATVTGGSRYKDGYKSTEIYVKNLTTGKTTKVDYAKNPSYIKDTWVPTEAGSYTATFKAVDYKDVVVESTISFTVLAKLTVSSFTVSNTNGSSIYKVNDTLKFSATVTGGQRYKDGYTSTKIYIKRNNKDYTVVDYAKNPSYIKDTWKPTAVGNYTATFKVVDYDGVTAEKTISFKVIKPLGMSDISSSRNSSMTLGQSSSVSVQAYDGAGSYKYACYYKRTADEKNNKVTESWVKVSGYVSNQAFSFNPSKAGTYVVRVYSKDANGTSVFKERTITVAPALKNTTTISLSSARVNKDTVALACAATGGKTAYKYAVYYKLSTDQSWTTLQSYSTKNSCYTKFSKTGTYTVRAYVKDANGMTSKKDFTVVVK